MVSRMAYLRYVQGSAPPRSEPLVQTLTRLWVGALAIAGARPTTTKEMTRWTSS